MSGDAGAAAIAAAPCRSRSPSSRLRPDPDLLDSRSARSATGVYRPHDGGRAGDLAKHGRIPWIVEHGFFYVGRAMLLLPLVAALAMVRRRALVARVWGWTALALLPILAMIHSAAPLWSWLPFGAYIQFPWRLLGFVSLFGAIAWGAAWADLIPARPALAWPLAVVVCAAVAFDGWGNLPRVVPLSDVQVPKARRRSVAASIAPSSPTSTFPASSS